MYPSMGLYINHPGVFMNTGKLVEPNQVEFKRDHLSELFEQHLAYTQNLQEKVSHMSNSQQHWNQQQLRQWGSFDLRLGELKQQVINSIERLEAQNQKIEQTMYHEQQANDNLFNQVNKISNSQKEIVTKFDVVEEEQKGIIDILNELTVVNDAMMKRLEQVTSMSEQMNGKMEEQYQLNEQIINQISSLKDSQNEVLNRVDSHEGLMEKIMRQIDHLREIVYERSSFLEEKVEKIYQNSSAYFQKLKNGI